MSTDSSTGGAPGPLPDITIEMTGLATADRHVTIVAPRPEESAELSVLLAAARVDMPIKRECRRAAADGPARLRRSDLGRPGSTTPSAGGGRSSGHAVPVDHMADIDVAPVADAEVAEMVWAEVERRWPKGVVGLDEIARYGLVPFGKMMGPWLLIRSSLAVGGEMASVLPGAVAVECIQVGAMMHDDIIDGDPQRRAKPAAHAVFGTPTAIVGGDGLFFHGFAALSECQEAGVPVARVGRALTILTTAGLRIGRAALQEIRMSRGICPIDTYLSMIKDKSGALLWMACGVGAALGGADEMAITALSRYSDLLGIGYQIRDDLMAYDGTSAGKPNVSDVRNGRPTLPVLLAHSRAPRDKQLLIEQLLADTTSAAEERHGAMAGLVHAFDGVRSARKISHHYARMAAMALNDLPPSEHRNALAKLTVPGRLV